MTIFELVKLALDELYEEGKAEYGKDVDAKIIERIKYLSQSYGELHSEERKAIDYSDPATRFAYVYKYVATHGDYVVQALERFRSVNNKRLFPEDQMRVTCVGGGPGSELIGLVKYLTDNKAESVDKVLCYLLDGEQAWADTWTEISGSMGTEIGLNVNFQPLDVTNPTSWSSQKKFLQSNLFILSYFVSEVYAVDDGTVSQFWKKIFDSANSGSVFIYVDNGHELFNDYFDEQWEDRGDIEAIYTKDNELLYPHFEEQKSEYGDYLTKFGQVPKMRSQLSMRILRKK